MESQIVLFDKARTKVGCIKLLSSTRELTFDWERKQPAELSDAVTSLLKTVAEEKSVKARREVSVTREDGNIVRVQKTESVPIDDPNFLVALTDRINRTSAFRTKIFAVFQRD